MNLPDQTYSFPFGNQRDEWQNSGDKIALPTMKGLEFIRLSEIIRLEAAGSYSQIYLHGKRSMVATRSLGEFEKMLQNQQFFRVYRSHLINLEHMIRYFRGKGGSVEMSDGSLVTVSKRKKEKFLDKLSQM